MNEKINSVLPQSAVVLLLAIIITSCSAQSVPMPTPVPAAPATTVAGKPTVAATAATFPPSERSSLLERPCDVYLPKDEVEGETILCGFVRVPWDRDDPDSATTDLAYVILKATGNNPQPDPIVHISGGPGSGATLREVVPEMIKRYAPLRQGRDIILYDQRGMGHSQPFFACPYPDETQAAALQEELAATAIGEIGEADVENAFCQQELAAQGYPASGISTANSAADLMDVMTALGYPEYNLYGISYGTRLAMSLMHHFPDSPLLRSIVLDSTYPLPEDKVNDFMAAPLLAQQTLFEAVFQACEDDPSCADAYPELRRRFDDLVAELAASPLDLGEGERFASDDLYRMVYPFNRALNYIPYQPRLIAELEQGDTTTLKLLRSGLVPGRNAVTGAGPDVDGFSDLLDAFLECSADVSDGDRMDEGLVGLWDADVTAIKQFIAAMCQGDNASVVNELLDGLAPGAFNGIIARFAPETVQGVNSALNIKLSCAEQYPFREEASSIEVTLREAGLPGFFVEETMAAMASNGEGCAVWSDAMTEPTPSTYGQYPVLIMSGQFDYITPPEMADIAAQELPDAQLLRVPNAMHSILGNQGECPTEMVRQFLTAPEQSINTGCVSDMTVEFLTTTNLTK